MKKLDLESCFLQEICRLVLIALISNDNRAYNNNIINDAVFLKPDQSMV
jgi:hypothetical protein